MLNITKINNKNIIGLLVKATVILSAIILLLSSCNRTEKDRDLTIGDIAYDVNKKLGYTVYIRETDFITKVETLVPYLVLTDDYNGNVLLLRKYLVGSEIYNDYLGYYNGSYIDNYLNETFLPLIDAELQESIIDSDITITAKSSLGLSRQDVEQINRKIFLLSYTELGLEGSPQACIEGTSLKYFTDDYMRRIAYDNTGAKSWMLRTSYNSYDCTAWGISPKGVIGGGGAYYENGIRPAFCLPRDIPIYKDTIDGEPIYIFPTGSIQE